MSRVRTRGVCRRRGGSAFDVRTGQGAVYQIDPETGVITFGDGASGRVPPKGAQITATYRSRRAGFVDYYKAMKAVDPDIKIYAGYESRNIIKTLGDKHPYDGVVVHPYTNQHNVPKAGTLEEWHHNLMLSSARLGHEVAEYQALIDKTMAPERRGRVHVICTEFGAIGQEQVMPEGTGQGYYRFLDIGLYTGAPPAALPARRRAARRPSRHDGGRLRPRAGVRDDAHGAGLQAVHAPLR